MVIEVLLEQYNNYVEGQKHLHYCVPCIITHPFRWNISTPDHPSRVNYCLTVTTEMKNNEVVKGTLMKRTAGCRGT